MSEPIKLIAGDREQGFFGEVSSVDFINGVDLANLAGLSLGSLRNNETNWLKFIYNDKVLFIPKLPIRTSISRNNLVSANVIYGNKEIVINNQSYKIRLIKGGNSDPASARGGEWNILMYGVHGNTEPNWANYTNEDLGLAPSSLSGSRTICQELAPNGTSVVHRGQGDITAFSNNGIATDTTSTYGWRPVLERDLLAGELTTIKHLIKSQNKIHTLLDSVLTYPNITNPTQEHFEQYGMDTLKGYENQISKVAYEMTEAGILGDGRVIRKTINKNDFKINGLRVK